MWHVVKWYWFLCMCLKIFCNFSIKFPIRSSLGYTEIVFLWAVDMCYLYWKQCGSKALWVFQNIFIFPVSSFLVSNFSVLCSWNMYTSPLNWPMKQCPLFCANAQDWHSHCVTHTWTGRCKSSRACVAWGVINGIVNGMKKKTDKDLEDQWYRRRPKK